MFIPFGFKRFWMSIHNRFCGSKQKIRFENIFAHGWPGKNWFNLGIFLNFLLSKLWRQTVPLGIRYLKTAKFQPTVNHCV